MTPRTRRRRRRAPDRRCAPVFGVVGGQDAVLVERVELIAIDDRRRDVGAVAIVAPGDRLARRSALRQRDVAARAGAHGIHRPDRRIAGGDDREIAVNDRRADRDLGIRRERPQQRARRRDRSRAPWCRWSRARRPSVPRSIVGVRPRGHFIRSGRCATARGRSRDRTRR